MAHTVPSVLSRHTIEKEYHIRGMTPEEFFNAHSGLKKMAHPKVVRYTVPPSVLLRHTVPSVLLRHTIEKEYHIRGITPRDVFNPHSGFEYNMEELKVEFKKHCDDYMEELEQNKSSKALLFCIKIIFQIGPELRKAKPCITDKVWKFIFHKAQNEHRVFVANSKPENVQYTSNCMVLPVEAASLLALETFSRFIKMGYHEGYKFLTPLACAFFSKDDTSSLAEELGITEVELLVNLSQSTQSGGQYLRKSDIDIAVCSSIAATRNLTDENLRKGIVITVLKAYINKGFAPDKNRIAIISKYVPGGVPSEFAYEELIKVLDSEQKKYSAIKIARARKQSEMYVRVLVPGSSKEF